MSAEDHPSQQRPELLRSKTVDPEGSRQTRRTNLKVQRAVRKLELALRHRSGEKKP